MKSVELSESYVYWKWATKEILAIVSDKSVYHLDVTSDQTALTKIFDRYFFFLIKKEVEI